MAILNVTPRVAEWKLGFCLAISIGSGKQMHETEARLLEIIILRYGTTCVRTQSFEQISVLDDTRECLCKPMRILLRNKKAVEPIPDDFRNSRNRSADDRQAASQSLDDRDRQNPRFPAGP